MPCPALCCSMEPGKGLCLGRLSDLGWICIAIGELFFPFFCPVCTTALIPQLLGVSWSCASQKHLHWVLRWYSSSHTHCVHPPYCCGHAAVAVIAVLGGDPAAFGTGGNICFAKGKVHAWTEPAPCGQPAQGVCQCVSGCQGWEVNALITTRFPRPNRWHVKLVHYCAALSSSRLCHVFCMCCSVHAQQLWQTSGMLDFLC